MSSESDSSTTSRIRQFGLYRTIDERTEEFLRLSRKRQIRQGCACAAVSTAITVTIVVVILLIYEYTIAVEYSLVQRKGNVSRYNDTDNPVADRLNRKHFGYDQDYFERMPLLVNAMQENSYNDPLVESSLLPKKYYPSNKTKSKSTVYSYGTTTYRKTSPRPFVFEYRTPSPIPFRKTYGSRSWVENYRNAQRLQNLQQIIKYLEQTINAKFGDVHDSPTSHIAFSGLFIEPMLNTKEESKSELIKDLTSQTSEKVESFKTNHKSDPLFSFKPDSPGDVNLLADGFLRFSPVIPNLPMDNLSPKIPMFRPIGYRKRNIDTSITFPPKTTNTESPLNKHKTFSVMLNLFPLNSPINTEFKKQDSIILPTKKVYFTTSKPIIQFRRKSTVPTNPMKYPVIRRKKPRKFVDTRMRKNMNINNVVFTDKNNNSNLDSANVILHVNVYKINKSGNIGDSTTEGNLLTTTTQWNKETPLTEMPHYVSSTQVEDFHVGSSGVIPVESRSTSSSPILPQVTTMIPFFDSTTPITDLSSWSSNPPKIVKFSAEDAKVPDHYRNVVTSEYTPTEMSRRNFMEEVEMNSDNEEETGTLVVKLQNSIDSTTAYSKNTENIETTTAKTYVPQINGHYRSINQNSRNINHWLNGDTESERKRKLEMSIRGFRTHTYVPMYKEIIRNHTRHSSENSDEQ